MIGISAPYPSRLSVPVGMAVGSPALTLVGLSTCPTPTNQLVIMVEDTVHLNPVELGPVTANTTCSVGTLGTVIPWTSPWRQLRPRGYREDFHSQDL
jgi:hypothetical protein